MRFHFVGTANKQIRNKCDFLDQASSRYGQVISSLFCLMLTNMERNLNIHPVAVIEWIVNFYDIQHIHAVR
jgi:hypothetical protein